MRKCDNWLKSWLQYSSSWESPERFRLWSGIAAISAVAQRKIFAYVKGQRLFANTYILLIGSPGSGKGNAMKYLAQWLKELKEDDFSMAPDGLTKRAFYMELEAARIFPDGNHELEQHSLTAFIEELGVFLHPGDTDFVYALCHVYDCPKKFEYKTASSGSNFANNACFSMLSACTPKALRDIYSEDAMELGISARTIIVFADDKVEVDIFGKPKHRDQLKKDLQYDLRHMLNLHGEYQFDEEAAKALVKWSKEEFSPKPKDPRFEHYNSRRFVQIVKLCMIVAMSKRDDPIILIEDFNDTKSILLECERHMPKAIETLGANPLLIQQNSCLTYVNEIYRKHSRGATEAELLRLIERDVAPHLRSEVLTQMANAKWVTVAGSPPERVFYPRGKEKERIKKEKEDDKDI